MEEKIRETRGVLEHLNSALALMNSHISKLAEATAKAEKQKIRQDAAEEGIANKSEELNKREKAVAHIESISNAIEKSKVLAKEVDLLNKNAEERQTMLDGGLKKLAKDIALFNADVASHKIMNQKQVDALKKERGDFEAKLKAAKALGSIVK